MQLPPPIHGASAVNQSIQYSNEINNSIDAHYVNTSPAKKMDDIGIFSFSKFYSTCLIVINAVSSYFTRKPDLVYITLSPHGIALYKDGLLAFLLKLFGASVVYHLHGKGITENCSKSLLKRCFYRSIFNNVDVIHLSSRLFYDVESVRDKKRLLLAVPNSVSIAPLNQISTISKNKIRFIFLSNFVKY
jgi:hypothetical protein